MKETWLLRWKFEYNDHKPTKFGQWNKYGNHPTDFAWAQPKSNLLRAVIEGKNYYTREISTFAECPGHAFLNFQWVGGTQIPLKPKGGKVIRQPTVLGLTLLTPTRSYTFYINGKREDKPTPPELLKLNFAGLGR